VSGWWNKLMAGFSGADNASARNTLFPPDDPSQIWRSDNPVGTETVQSLGMPQPTVYAGPVGQYVDPNTGQLTTRGQARMDNPMMGFDTGGVGAIGSIKAAARTMDSPEFVKWFSGSKAVNEAGEPLTLYHGTNKDFDVFNAMEGKQRTDAPGFASSFSDDPGLASSYAKRAGSGANVVPVHLNLQNPMEVTGDSWHHLISPVDGVVWSPRYGQFLNVKMGDGLDINEMTYLAKKSGYDGLIARDIGDAARASDKGKQSTYVAFDPKQIKSAIGNSGAFDPKDPRITAGIAGLMAGGGAAALGGQGGTEQ
jgi:hypothetical protein